jgi:hypothetical protein
MNAQEWPAVKAQWVRLVDVFVLGPAMVLGGAYAARGGAPWLGLSVSVGGAATIVYNAVNYGRVKEREAALKAGRPPRWHLYAEPTAQLSR